MITRAELKNVLEYNPLTGLFAWTQTRGFIKRGTRAGGLINGAVYITFDDMRYLAKNLAWLYMKGRMPKKAVQHINGDKTDLQWSNLTERKSRTNKANERIDVGIEKTALGYRVVSFDGDESKDLGTYPEFTDAVNVQWGRLND